MLLCKRMALTSRKMIIKLCHQRFQHKVWVTFLVTILKFLLNYWEKACLNLQYQLNIALQIRHPEVPFALGSRHRPKETSRVRPRVSKKGLAHPTSTNANHLLKVSMIAWVLKPNLNSCLLQQFSKNWIFQSVVSNQKLSASILTVMDRQHLIVSQHHSNISNNESQSSLNPVRRHFQVQRRARKVATIQTEIQVLELNSLFPILRVTHRVQNGSQKLNFSKILTVHQRDEHSNPFIVGKRSKPKPL